MITAAQCRAGRALAELSLDMLARLSGTEVSVIQDFERKVQKPNAETISRIKLALEDGGVVFLPEDDSAGVGVRLKFNRATTKQIGVLEGEGGITGYDDVP